MIEKCVYMPFTYLFSKTVMAAGAHMCICMCVGRRGKEGMGMGLVSMGGLGMGVGRGFIPNPECH